VVGGRAYASEKVEFGTQRDGMGKRETVCSSIQRIKGREEEMQPVKMPLTLTPRLSTQNALKIGITTSHVLKESPLPSMPPGPMPTMLAHPSRLCVLW